GVRLLTASTTTELITNTLLFFAILISGIFLTQSLSKEARDKEQIETLAEGLEEANEEQQSLIRFISHQVKGYLTRSAAVVSAILQDDTHPLPQNTETLLRKDLASTTEGISTINNVLEAANLKKGTMTFSMQPFDLVEALNGVMEEFRPAAELKGLSVSVDIQRHQDFRIVGDQEKISSSLLKNVLENALTYTESGSITIVLRKVNDTVRLTVTDTGIGITDTDMQKLFSEGGRGTESTKINVYSTGYGLYIARKVAQAHGGNITAQSEGANRGSVFIVELPAAK
ncbi:MAG TPA: HAMP domain-containing sensor histidine kinase, partial [Blastocatellia bacterium]|nr:HAMP domain-containing sensor histidine kinase [Blastocatellia bacterium]